MPTVSHIREKDIRAGIKGGGNIRGCFLIAREVGDSYEFLPYIRPSWNKAHLPLYTWLGKEVRTYKDVGRFVKLVREDFGFTGSIAIHFQGSGELARFRSVLPEDAP